MWVFFGQKITYPLEISKFAEIRRKEQDKISPDDDFYLFFF